jgi:hypothetical protein
MTDNEIMEALKCCSVSYECPDCAFEDDCGGMASLSTAAIDLINRQKAEIEKLQAISEAKLDKIHCLQTEVERLEDLLESKERLIDALIKGQESLTNYIDILTRR